jgi:hypothetical protein
MTGMPCEPVLIEAAARVGLAVVEALDSRVVGCVGDNSPSSGHRIKSQQAVTLRHNQRAVVAGGATPEIA